MHVHHIVLLFTGIIHAIGEYALLTSSKNLPMGVLSLEPVIWGIAVPALLVTGAVISRISGAQLRWVAIVAFAAWEACVGYCHLLVWQAASAAV